MNDHNMQTAEAPMLTDQQWVTVLRVTTGVHYPPGVIGVDNLRRLAQAALGNQYQNLQQGWGAWRQATELATAMDGVHPGSGDWAMVSQLASNLKPIQRSVGVLEFALAPITAMERRRQATNTEDILFQNYAAQLTTLAELQRSLLLLPPTPPQQSALISAWQQEISCLRMAKMHLTAALVSEQGWKAILWTVNPQLYLDPSREATLASLHDGILAREAVVQTILAPPSGLPHGAPIAATPQPLVALISNLNVNRGQLPQGLINPNAPVPAPNVVVQRSPQPAQVAAGEAINDANQPGAPQHDIDTANAWLMNARPFLHTQNRLLDVLDSLTNGNRAPGEVSLAQLHYEAQRLLTAASNELNLMRARYETESQTISDEESRARLDELRNLKNRMELLKLMFQPETVLEGRLNVIGLENQALSARQDKQKHARDDVDRLENHPDAGQEEALAAARQAELLRIDELREILSPAIDSASDWIEVLEKACPEIPVDTSRKTALQAWDEELVARKAELEIQMRHPQIASVGEVAEHNSQSGRQTPQNDMDAEGAWLERARPFLTTDANLVAVLQRTNRGSYDPRTLSMRELRKRASELHKWAIDKLPKIEAELAREIESVNQQTGGSATRVNELTIQLRQHRNNLGALALTLEPDSALQARREKIAKENQAIADGQKSLTLATQEVNRLEALPVSGSQQNELIQARQMELVLVHELRDAIEDAAKNAVEWTAMQQSACTDLLPDRSRQKELRGWDHVALMRQSMLEIHLEFPGFAPSTADAYLVSYPGMQSWATLWKGLNPTLKDSLWKLHELEHADEREEMPRPERKKREIALAPPLRVALQIYLPADKAEEIASAFEKHVANDTDMSDYIPGVASMLTRSMLTADYMMSDASRAHFTERWREVFEYSLHDDHTRDVLLTAKEYLGDCPTPTTEALQQSEEAARLFAVSSIAHDPAKLIDYTEDKFKGAVIDSVDPLVRATLLSDREELQTTMQLKKLAGAALGMKNAIQVVTYEEAGGVTDEHVECVRKLHETLVDGKRDGIKNAIQPLRTRMNLIGLDNYRNPTYVNRCSEMRRAFVSQAKRLEEKQQTFDECLREGPLADYMQSLYEQESHFESDRRQVEEEKLAIQKERGRVDAQIDEYDGINKPDPYQQLKREPGWTDAEFEQRKASHEIDMAPLRTEVDKLLDQQTELYLEEQNVNEVVKTRRLIGLSKQFMVVKALTEKETKRDEAFEYRPLIENTDSRLDRTMIKYPVVAQRLMQMQFDIAREGGAKRIKIDPSSFNPAELKEVRLAAQLAGRPLQLTGCQPEDHVLTTAQKAEFIHELNIRLMKLCANMSEQALNRYQLFPQENTHALTLAAGGTVIKVDEKGSAWVNARELSAVPKLVRFSPALQTQLGITLQLGDTVGNALVNRVSRGGRANRATTL